MNIFFRSIIPAFLALAISVDGLASDTTSHKESDATTYIVQKNDSFYGICHKLGVTTHELLDANPTLINGVKTGQKLIVPTHHSQQLPVVSDDTEPSGNQDQNLGQEVRLRPVKPEIVIGQAVFDQLDEPPTIVVMLPFDLNAEKLSRQAQTSLEFYRGLLIAADTMTRRVRIPMQIVAIDTRESADRVRRFCATDTFANAAVVIAPDDAAGLSLVSREGRRHDTYIFNAFSVRDSSYISNHYVLQSYIPSAIMYQEAMREFEELFLDATPVFIHREGALDDKAEFIERLRSVYQANGLPTYDITFNGALTFEDFAVLPDNGHYVLIPGSASTKEFDRYAHFFIKAVEENPGSSLFDVWGYPDWTAFRGSNLEQLHRMGAVIFTRFYCNQESTAYRNLSEAYADDFGGSMADAAPMPAPMGYDVGCYIIETIIANGGKFIPGDNAYYGVQSSFHFVQPDHNSEAGYYNDELYIIRFDRYGTDIERLN